MFNKSFSLIVAFDKSYGIGLKNTIPWKLPHDLLNFKKLTTNNIVIMGKKTWNSLPIRPLPNRINIILTSSPSYSFNDVHYVNSFNKALDITTRYNTNKEIFVIGGLKIYEEALKNENCQTLYLSILDQDYKCDTFFPSNYLDNFKIISDSFETGYIYRKCKRLKINDLINQEELQYLNLVKDVLDKGKYVNDRTQIGRIVRFGNQIRFNLNNNVLPLLTTKKMFVKGVIGELLWMFHIQIKRYTQVYITYTYKYMEKNTKRNILLNETVDRYQRHHSNHATICSTSPSTILPSTILPSTTSPSTTSPSTTSPSTTSPSTTSPSTTSPSTTRPTTTMNQVIRFFKVSIMTSTLLYENTVMLPYN